MASRKAGEVCLARKPVIMEILWEDIEELSSDPETDRQASEGLEQRLWLIVSQADCVFWL